MAPCTNHYAPALPARSQFISMPLAIVGSSFASSCDKLVAIQAQKDAVKVTCSAAHNYCTP